MSSSALRSPFLFTGREYDAESGLYHYRARAYDPDVGQFLQRDPLGYVAGLSDREYVRSSPASMRDPTGMLPDLGGLVQAVQDAIEEHGEDVAQDWEEYQEQEKPGTLYSGAARGLSFAEWRRRKIGWCPCHGSREGPELPRRPTLKGPNSPPRPGEGPLPRHPRRPGECPNWEDEKFPQCNPPPGAPPEQPVDPRAAKRGHIEDLRRELEILELILKHEQVDFRPPWVVVVAALLGGPSAANPYADKAAGDLAQLQYDDFLDGLREKADRLREEIRREEQKLHDMESGGR